MKLLTQTMSFASRIVRNFRSGHLSFKRVVQANGLIDFVHFSKKADLPIPPKRPLTSYMFFCKENRKELLEKNPDLSTPQQIKVLAEKWNQLNVESRKPFELMARESTLLYGEEHKRFYENLSEEQKLLLAKQKSDKRESRRIHKLKKALRDSGLPKPAKSAYALFVQSHAGEKNDVKQPGGIIKHFVQRWNITHAAAKKEFLKEVAEKWREVSAETKQSFENQAEADKTRYMTEMEEWKKKMLGEGHEKLLNEYDSKFKGKSFMSELSDSTKLKPKKSKTLKDEGQEE